MAGCKSCPSHSSCANSSTQGGSGNCMDDKMSPINETLQQIKNKLFIMSGKGGVGKSSVTVNLAVALALKGFRTGILDVDLHGPSIPNLLGIKSGLRADEESGKILPALWNENLSIVSMDTLLQDRDQPVLWRGPMKSQAIQQFLGDVKWGPLDFLLIDSPPGTGDEHMTVLKTIPDAKSIVVTTPQELSLADVRKAINFLHEINAQILGLVENMSGLACPGCGMEIPLFKTGGGAELAKSFNIPLLGVIPLDPGAVVAADLGVPVVSMEKDGPAKKAFLQLAEKVADFCQ